MRGTVAKKLRSEAKRFANPRYTERMYTVKGTTFINAIDSWRGIYRSMKQIYKRRAL